MSTLLTVIAVASSLQGQCLLEVEDGWKLFEGGCNIEMAEGGDMTILTNSMFTFEDGTSAPSPSGKGLQYDIFVDVTGPKRATGEWKGNWASMKWLNDMGQLTRDGACWVNDSSKICAWR